MDKDILESARVLLEMQNGLDKTQAILYAQAAASYVIASQLTELNRMIALLTSSFDSKYYLNVFRKG